MAKNIRWKIPFVSIQGVHYRVDIYDEGTFTPVQLTAGPTPFVTNEDASDDFFHPVRTQSGTLQVCTLKPDGAYITLDELLPANNIARPVRLLNRDNSDAIEWQGFLSCEAYSQDYTGIPQILDIPLISVLEAMESVSIGTTSSWLKPINEIIYQALTNIEQESLMPGIWQNIYYSAQSYRIFEKKLDITQFINEEQYSTENYPTTVLKGDSCKSVLEKLCKYMGWTVREQGRSVFFERLNETIGLYRDGISAFRYDFHTNATLVSLTTKSLASDVTWKGTRHQRTIMQGAKSVKVVAKIEDVSIDLKLPPFPYGPMTNEIEYYFAEYKQDGHTTPYLKTTYSKAITAYSNLLFNYYYGNLSWTDGKVTSGQYAGTSNLDDTIAASAWYQSNWNIGKSTYNAGAFYVYHTARSQSGQYADSPYIRGLFCSFIPQLTAEDIPIFSISSLKSYALQKGRLTLKIKFSRFVAVDQRDAADREEGNENRWYFTDNEGHWTKNFWFAFSIGGKYYDGSSWQNQRTIEQHTQTGIDYELDIDINSYMSGNIKFEIMGCSYGQGGILTLAALIDSIELDYEPDTSYLERDASENTYFQKLTTNFRDEIGINVDFASWMNNHPSPSLIMNTTTQPMEGLAYDITTSFTFGMRPEVDLLNRLAEYYGAARQRLELEVAHPTAAPLPLLKLNGINDGKVYLPLSESRDWQTDVCKLTCFEMPQ